MAADAAVFTVVPNDPLYEYQWHYSAIGLPEAWELSKGSQNVVVAVLDTGILATHPDLSSRLTSDGYDFVSQNGGDGVGRDANPSDPGDRRDNTLCVGSTDRVSTFHGTHVAGTVGAVSDNEVGLTGVTWFGDIMDLRVLGCRGGSSFDIATAIRYAAGLANATGLLPSKKADVINMSLGGSFAAAVTQNAIAAARAAGVIIVASSGNGGAGANDVSYPASFAGVISVGATTITDSIANYSTFNNAVDIAAPGGSGGDVNADGLADLVFSTHAAINPANNVIQAGYDGKPGTSMAAPHVAGVIALMKSLYDFTPDELDQVIASGDITTDLGATGRDDYFGYGKIDAYKALLVAQSMASGGAVPTNPVPASSVLSFFFGRINAAQSFTLANAGTGDLQVTSVTVDDLAISLTAPGTSDGLGEYTAILDRTGVANGVHKATITVNTNSLSTPVLRIQVTYEVADVLPLNPDVDIVWINFYEINEEVSNWYSLEPSNGSYNFSINDLIPGVYEVFAGSDPDNDGYIGGLTDVFGQYPNTSDPVLLVANGNFVDLDFSLGLEAPVSQLARPDSLDSERRESRCSGTKSKFFGVTKSVSANCKSAAVPAVTSPLKQVKLQSAR